MVWDWKDERAHSVMGLVQLHEGEYRRWHPNWGPSQPGFNQDWQMRRQPAVGGRGADDPFVWHHQLQLIPLTSSPPFGPAECSGDGQVGVVWLDDSAEGSGPAMDDRA